MVQFKQIKPTGLYCFGYGIDLVWYNSYFVCFGLILQLFELLEFSKLVWFVGQLFFLSSPETSVRVKKVVKEEKQITSLLLPFSWTPLSDLHVLSTIRFVEFLSLFSNFRTKIYICQLTKVLISRELTNDPFFLDSVGRIKFLKVAVKKTRT